MWIVAAACRLLLATAAQKLESRKFTYDSRTGEYVNAHDERDRIPREQLQELSRALSTAAVKETVVDIMQRRATLRKMSKASRLFLQCNKKDLSTLSVNTPQLPPPQACMHVYMRVALLYACSHTDACCAC